MKYKRNMTTLHWSWSFVCLSTVIGQLVYNLLQSVATKGYKKDVFGISHSAPFHSSWTILPQSVSKLFSLTFDFFLLLFGSLASVRLQAANFFSLNSAFSVKYFKKYVHCKLPSILNITYYYQLRSRDASLAFWQLHICQSVLAYLPNVFTQNGFCVNKEKKVNRIFIFAILETENSRGSRTDAPNIFYGS